MTKQESYEEIKALTNQLVKKIHEFQKVHRYHPRMKLVKSVADRLQIPLRALNNTVVNNRFKLVTTGKGKPQAQPLPEVPQATEETVIVADNSPEGLAKIKKNKQAIDARFKRFWLSYDQPRDKRKCRAVWDNLEEWEQEDAYNKIKEYKSSVTKAASALNYLTKKLWDNGTNEDS